MSGILDQKTRVMDVLLTKEGRRQLSEGQLSVKFYAFSDASTIYSMNTIVSGGLDETNRFVLEPSGQAQDSIVFEANDGGKLVGFPTSGSDKFTLLNGQVYSSSLDAGFTMVSGAQFSSLSEPLLNNSIDAFKNQMFLQSPDPIDQKERTFIVGTPSISFDITNNKPFNDDNLKEAKIEHIESLFHDKKLSHLPNFKFLPPVNRARVGTNDRILLGDFVNLGQEPIETFEQLQTSELNFFEKQGFSKTVSFLETSKNNNILAQFFEVSDDNLKKLDVIDFGIFYDKTTNTNKHVFFVGKVFIDNMSSPTFVNMFTLIFY